MRHWWRAKQPEPAVQMKIIVPERHEAQTYRGYHLEVKSLAVGWQVIITKNDSYVSNGSIKADLKFAIDEAHTVIDTWLDAALPILG